MLGALGDGPLGVTEVADRAGLPKSTAARAAGHARRRRARSSRSRATRRTGSGRGSSRSAAGFSLTRSLAAIARPMLIDLAEASGEAAGLAMPDGDLVHYIDQVDTLQPGPGARLDRARGSRSTPCRRARCSSRSGRRPRSSAISSEPMERFTDRTLTDADAVRERLREVRRQGYAWAIEEFEDGISSVAAPIADASGEVIAAVHVHGPSYRIPGRRLEGGSGAARARRGGADRRGAARDLSLPSRARSLAEAGPGSPRESRPRRSWIDRGQSIAGFSSSRPGATPPVVM